jgi:hypothetical protein
MASPVGGYSRRNVPRGQLFDQIITELEAAKATQKANTLKEFSKFLDRVDVIEPSKMVNDVRKITAKFAEGGLVTRR